MLTNSCATHLMCVSTTTSESFQKWKFCSLLICSTILKHTCNGVLPKFKVRYDIINCQSAITTALKASLKLTNTNNSASLGPTVNIIDKYDARAVYYACFVCIVYRQPQECDNIMFIYVIIPAGR